MVKGFLHFLLFVFFFSTFFVSAEEINKIIAVVNNEVITQQELDYNLLPLYEQYKAVYQNKDLDKKLKRAKKNILEQMIENKLILEEAEKRGIKASEEEIEKEIAKARKRFSSSEEFTKTLRQENLNIQKLRERYKEQIMIRKTIQDYLVRKVDVTPEEIASYYEEHIDDFTQPERVKIRMLSFASKDKAIETLNKLRAGDEFRDGEVKFVARGEMIPQIDSVIFSLKIGEFSGLIKTELGYCIFKVEGKQQKEISSFPKVRDKIENILWQKKSAEEFNKWMEELKEDAYIEIR
ncbi:MAG: SurA N-terminal domain-containing protein [Candidatus Omnitrophica bacterium]|nr:SurA N-terminal domain-containing protein [Candidatus Omnitrophota bacterium]